MRVRDGGSGPVVIKVSGLAGGSGLYDEEVAVARARGFRVVSVDSTGDRADDPAPGRLDWDGLTGELAAVLDRLAVPRALLWGTSFGALVCLATAARHPRRVAGLLLAFPAEPGWRPAPHLALLRWAERRADPARAAASAFHACFVVLNLWEFVVPAALRRLPHVWRAMAEARTPAATIRDKLGLLFRDHPGMPPRSLPCSIIAGGWDLVAPAAGARRLAAALPGSRLRILRCAGHAGAYSRARAYTRWSVDELTRLVE